LDYSPFIYSYGQRNIAATGRGSLNGPADANHRWNWKKGIILGSRWGSTVQSTLKHDK